MSCYNNNKNNTFYGNSNYWSTNGHIEGLCDGTKYTVYDYWFPLAKIVIIDNTLGECDVIGYLSYSDGFYIKVEKRTIAAGDIHKFDLVGSLLKVVVQCEAYETSANALAKCKFDYTIY